VRAFLVCLALLAGVSLIGAGGAVAADCGGSAGDTQYVDPLACGGGSSATSGGSTTSHPTTPSSPPRTSTPLVASTGTTRTTSGGTVSAASATATTARASTATTPAASSSSANGAAQDLPYTGLDVRTLLVLGVALLAAGLLLRRVASRRLGG
jgi:hypothetical protein